MEFSTVWECLKPVDKFVIFYLTLSCPAIFIHGVVVQGVVMRLSMFLIVWLRYLLVFSERFSTETKFKPGFSFKELKKLVQPAVLISLLLDLYPLIWGILIYGEDGPIIENIYQGSNKFYDLHLMMTEANMFQIDPVHGLGHHLRSKTGPIFNKVFGEYLHFCYFMFYVVLVGTYLFVWWCCPREKFDLFAFGEVLCYMGFLGFYIICPVAGPYWTYVPPDPKDVGYLFSYITHFLVSGGSSSGTAYPSGHCGVTICVWLLTFNVMPRLATVYAFICPAIVYATMWCGFHYFLDSIWGVIFGIMAVHIATHLVPVLKYRVPNADAHNYHVRPDRLLPMPLYDVEKTSLAHASAL